MLAAALAIWAIHACQARVSNWGGVVSITAVQSAPGKRFPKGFQLHSVALGFQPQRHRALAPLSGVSSCPAAQNQVKETSNVRKGGVGEPAIPAIFTQYDWLKSILEAHLQ